jgi:peptide/nickel transport system ATP-binding protein
MLELTGICKDYRFGLFGRNVRRVLDDVDLSVKRSEIIGLMGASGSGKTTLARIALRLVPCTQGSIELDGLDITRMKESKFRRYRSKVQIVFQHPEGALDPRFRLRESIEEALLQAGVARKELRPRLEASCESVSLPLDLLDRFPSQVSGGEIQRVAFARVLAFEPDYIFLDEPTSMLDVSVQAHILQIVRNIARQRQVGLVLISHDRDILRVMCDRVMVLSKGRVVAQGSPQETLGAL